MLGGYYTTHESRQDCLLPRKYVVQQALPCLVHVYVIYTTTAIVTVSFTYSTTCTTLCCCILHTAGGQKSSRENNWSSGDLNAACMHVCMYVCMIVCVTLCASDWGIHTMGDYWRCARRSWGGCPRSAFGRRGCCCYSTQLRITYTQHHGSC